MPRIIVTADPSAAGEPPVLLEESVQSVHISTDHAARQLIERLAWALRDAEQVEHMPRAGAPSAGTRSA